MSVNALPLKHWCVHASILSERQVKLSVRSGIHWAHIKAKYSCPPLCRSGVYIGMICVEVATNALLAPVVLAMELTECVTVTRRACLQEVTGDAFL